MAANTNPHNVTGIGNFTQRSPAFNRRIVEQRGGAQNTSIVRFHYNVTAKDRNGVEVKTHRTTTVLVDRPSALPKGYSKWKHWLRDVINEALLTNFADISSYDGDGDVKLRLNENGSPEVTIVEKSDVMTNAEVVRHLGLAGGGLPPPAAQVPMYGWNDEQQPQHRAFRYMIEGCDMNTLQNIVPDEWTDEHLNQCERMCAYRMLGDINVVSGRKDPPKVFRPNEINRWLNSNGHAVGGIYDGLSSDDIQAHAIHFRYGHCAMDLSRSILNLYIPEHNKERNHHYKTACYVVVGDHCQPIVDSNVVRSVMKSASSRVGQRRITGYHTGMVLQPKKHNTNHESGNIVIPTSSTSTTITKPRKRHRSLDRVFRPEYEKSEDRLQQDLWRSTNHDTPTDISLDDWEDDFSDLGSHVSMGDSTGPTGGAAGGGNRRFKLPLVSDRDRFHFYTKENDIALIEERCKPTYREGDDTTIIHYYICTDDDDVEFLYQYCIRVLKIDPMRYARSFNGRCRLIRMQNTWWSASKDIHQTMKLHEVLAPGEPFQPSGMATYAFRMLHKEISKITKRSGALWECMSHYPPNLQRLLDTSHPFQRPKLMQHTFNPPYSNPYSYHTDPLSGRTTSKIQGSSTPISTLIPEAHRRRIDLVRSYASTIRNLSHNDQYPIHDPTNTVVPYDESIHGSIPVGHYLVDLPTEDMVLGRTANASENGGGSVDNNSGAGEYGTLDDWKKLVCLPLGQARMMTHRMLRALLQRRLLTKSCIRLVCATDPVRQNRYGLALVLSLQNVLETIYRHPAMQTGEICPKHLINHLIGLCNGTSSPHSGMRYVFHDLKHLYNILTQIVSEDQLRRIRVCHTTGYDPMWHKSFDYYEIDSSGLTYKSLHLQPVYNMVLEDQAIRIFDLVRPIPVPHLIQINIDAIEYHVNPTALPDWAQTLATQTVSEEEYGRLTPSDMYEGYMGRFRSEKLKGPERAQTYYYQFQNSANVQATMNRFYSGRLLVDTESTDWVPNWKEALRVVPTPAACGQSQQTILEQLLVDIFTAQPSDLTNNDPETRLGLPRETPESRPGLLVTGPAGTGKTHFIRLLQSFASNLGLSVVKAAYTHAACVQMGCDAVTLSSLFGLDEKADVRCTMALSRRFAAQLRALDIDVLIIDEISMIPLLLLEVLMLFHRVSPKTRLCLVGDFHQLPPVEPGWERKDDYDYFHQTDIFPYLLYDRVRNQHGRWLQLTECMRTTDPLLVRICQDPTSVQSIDPCDFPMPSLGIPVWRFVSWRNSTRKACNFYCMHRFLQLHPDTTRVRLALRDLYAHKKYDEQRAKQQRRITDDIMVDEEATTAINEPSKELEPFFELFDKLHYRPPHWKYLQPVFTYAVDMEVVCRNTLREWDRNRNVNTTDTTTESKGNQSLDVVNNRRGKITDIDTAKRTITVRWLDIIRRWEESGEPSQNIEDLDVTFTYHDFAFNFVPGFCITAHMAQGETIREHYAVMEWPEMAANPRMAYVVVTRGSSSQYLHIVPKFADPWNTHDTTNETDNILRKLYHMFAWDKDSSYEVDIGHVAQKLKDQDYVCSLCKNTKLVSTRYNYKSPDQFMLYSSASVTARGPQASVNPSNLALCCNACYGNRFRAGGLTNNNSSS